MSDYIIRPFKEADWPDCWQLLHAVFVEGSTYPYPAETSENEARSIWIEGKTGVFTAEDTATGELLGTYFIKPNQPGRGAHVCNCGYITSSVARGRGIATAMCLHSQDIALKTGFRAMQFNFVVATNVGAARLWQKLGFHIIGTLPGVFDHPDQGWVDAHVMFKAFVDSAVENNQA
jgi:RimJ/RimL family protein N-acetyltransferase